MKQMTSPAAPPARRSLQHRIKNAISASHRRRRAALLREIIADTSREMGRPIRILDVGGKPAYWNHVGLDFLRDHQVSVVLQNIEASDISSAVPEMFTSVVGDACHMPEIEDGAFDIVHSNSVIEHVGCEQKMRAFASEVRRVGRRYYVQAPYRWFPWDPHRSVFAPMIHWAPKPIAARLLHWLPLSEAGRLRSVADGYAALNGVNMPTRRLMRDLFPAGRHVEERFCGLVKSLVVTG